MTNLKSDIREGAEWIARALSSSGYKADFSPQSLWEIDRFFEEQSKDGRAVRGGLLAEGLGQRIFCLGAYAGEVIRRHAGGEWVTNEDDPNGEINIELRLTEGALCWPVQRVMKRFKNGAEDGIAVWGLAFGLDVGPSTSSKKRR
jgi:hypothetical protein